MLYNQIWHNMLCQNECPNDQLCRIAIYVGICVTMPQQNVCQLTLVYIPKQVYYKILKEMTVLYSIPTGFN